MYKEKTILVKTFDNKTSVCRYVPSDFEGGTLYETKLIDHIFKNNELKFKNVYIISDEPISVGDCHYDLQNGNVEIRTIGSYNERFYTKVIASTDDSLGLPNIDLFDFNIFVTKDNQQIGVKYNEDGTIFNENGFIKLKPPKEDFTKDELYDILCKFRTEFLGFEKLTDQELLTWLNNNKY